MLVCKKDFVLLVSQCDSVFNSYSFSQPMCTTRAAHFIPISVSGQCLPSVYEIPPYLTPTSPQRQADSSKLPIPTHVPTATHSHAIPPSSPHSLPNLSLDPVPHCTGCPSQLPGERIASLCLLYPRMCQGTVRTTNNISPPPVFWHILMHGALSSPLLVRTPNSGFALLHTCFFCRVVAVTHC